MFRKNRKNYTGKEKVAIIRRHLVDQVAISDLCDEYKLRPTAFYHSTQASSFNTTLW